MHSRVNRMSQNSTQGARVLPGACAVLTCVFDCICYCYVRSGDVSTVKTYYVDVIAI